MKNDGLDIISKKFFFILALGMVFVSFLSTGYGALVSDQQIYLPAILNEQNSQLLSNDFLLSFRQTNLTLFDELVVILSKMLPINIYWILFALIFLARFIFFFSLARLAGLLRLKKIAVILFVLVSAFAVEVYGSGIKTVTVEFHPRFLALSLGVLFLVFFLEKRKKFSLLALGSSFLIHPLTSLIFLAFYYWRIFREKIIFQKKLWFFLIPLAFPLILLFWLKLNGLSWSLADNPFFLDKDWLAIMRERSAYLFVSLWEWDSLLWLLGDAFLLGFFLYEWKNNKENHLDNLLISMLILSGLFFLLSLILADVFKIAFVTSLQLSRSLIIWKIFLPLFLIVKLSERGENKNKLMSCFILTGLIVSFCFQNIIAYFVFLGLFVLLKIFAKADNFSKKLFDRLKFGFYWEGMTIFIIFFILIFRPSDFSVKPAQAEDKNLTGLCAWLFLNSSPGDTVLTEPFSKVSPLMRMNCERPVYFSEKDGAQGIFSREYAIEWKRRKDLAKSIKINSDEAREIATKEKIDFLVSDKKKAAIFIDKPVFENEKFTVWKLK